MNTNANLVKQLTKKYGTLFMVWYHNTPAIPYDLELHKGFKNGRMQALCDCDSASKAASILRSIDALFAPDSEYWRV